MRSRCVADGARHSLHAGAAAELSELGVTITKIDYQQLVGAPADGGGERALPTL
jgi:hypothetical protein